VPASHSCRSTHSAGSGWPASQRCLAARCRAGLVWVDRHVGCNWTCQAKTDYL
ncbi:uncharacterized protein METZ01_LOCUS295191, partial [marine metagenome]